jgi:uncharacterized peroxidase-related enzyme
MQNGYQIYDLNTASEAGKAVLEEVKRHYQFIPNALGAMAESPETVRAYLMLDEINGENSLSDIERHVVFLTISREHNCAYCVAAHSAFAQMGKVDGQIIQAIREGKPLTDPALVRLQALTTKLVKNGCHLSEQDIEEFLAAGYTRRHVLDIITMIANKMIAIYANRIMGTDLDEALLPAKWEHVA